MAKIDELKEKIATIREAFKNIFILLIATLSGTITVIYKIASKELEVYMVFFVILGIIALLFLTILIKKYWIKLDKLSEELRDV